MPEVKLQHVVSCSSADKNNPAENLLKSEGSHKWRCASAGEKSASVVLQLSKSSEISSVDIGNEGSAFVEVLVGKATAAADTDFEVLLVASSFMTPLESRNGTNRTGVRMFGLDKLNKTTATQKWDRVKVVCTQPFCKLSQYGLSFIKVHSPSSGEPEEAVVKKEDPETFLTNLFVEKAKKHFGAFSIKEEDDEDSLKVGSLFAKRSSFVDEPYAPSSALWREAKKGGFSSMEACWNHYRPEREANHYARLREEEKKAASTSSSSASPSHERPKTEESRKRPAEPSSSHASNAKVSKVIKEEKIKDEPMKEGSDTEEDELPPQKPKLQKTSTASSSVSSSSSKSHDTPSSMKRAKTEPSASPREPARDLSSIMRGVTFVLSGFQNPSRGQLRDQAMEMGAKYKSDWGKGCTHLICAFANTPKYKQVAGKGKIVTKGWVVDSYKRKQLQPWKKYRLGDAESPDESSEEEEEVIQRSEKPDTSKRSSPPPQRKEEEKSEEQKAKPLVKRSVPKKAPVVFESDSDSGGDTEDELRKAREIAAKQKSVTKTEDASSENHKSEIKTEDAAGYDVPTDEDEPGPSTASKDNDSDYGLPDLPEFFTDKNFFFYGDFETADQRLLTRYIAAYNGEVEEYMSKRVKYVVTAQKWDDNFEEALNENPELIFVKPKWISSCHDKQKLLPYQPYIVVPN